MKLLAEHYYQAALERNQQAQALYETGSAFAPVMYLAGVAIECLLRAFKLRRGDTLDERHDLARLLETCGILGLIGQLVDDQRLSAGQAEEYARDLKKAINQAAVLWSNDLRYASEQRLRSHLHQLRLGGGSKGDLLKALADRLLDSTNRSIMIGTRLWKYSARK